MAHVYRTSLALGLLTALLLSCSSSPPQPGQRPLTSAEIRDLRRQLAKSMAQLPNTIKTAPIYTGYQRDPIERQKLQVFQTAWAKVNPSIAHYLGSRAVTAKFDIYPSWQPGRVCVAYAWGDPAKGSGHAGGVLSVGQVENGQIVTDNNEIIFVEGPYLVMFVVDENNRPSQRLLPPAETYDRYLPVLEETEQSLQRLGCTAKLP
jgi:hypothetical protein